VALHRVSYDDKKKKVLSRLKNKKEGITMKIRAKSSKALPCCKTILRLEVMHPRRFLGNLTGEIAKANEMDGFIVEFSSDSAAETATLEADKPIQFCPCCGKPIKLPADPNGIAD
jgi:hypothetical protein